MCGIAGIVSTDPTVAHPAAVERMTRVIQHRGPDDSGSWHAAHSGGSVALGHRRLSIIDLSPAGHQPMANEDGSIWLTYNGEIYNHALVRTELERSGHQYRSHTDSETIVHAYEQFGDRCVERFRGMFAFAIWDGPRRRLLLARDRLGVKPVYYAQVGNTLVFASEIKAIVQSGLVAPRLASGGLSEYLMFGYRAGVDTMFAGIKKLPPGHILTWEDGRVTISCYWSLRFQPNTQATRQDFETEFRARFEESVRIRLMSDVPLGVFLSGGLDSSAIAAAMQPLVPGRIQTFSVGYESKYYSELPYARQVAQHIGSEHHEILLTAGAFQRAMPALVWHEDEPLWGAGSVGLYFVSELASRRVKVVLTGEGSDETFAGYDRYWMTALNARLLPAYRLLPRAGRAAIRRALVDGPLPERVRRALGHTFIQFDTMPDGLFFDSWFSVFTPSAQKEIGGGGLLADLAAGDPYQSHRDVFDQGVGDIVDRMLYCDIKTNLVELLMKQDQMSMATSIESRVPFLDHQLVEFAATVPSRFKIGRSSGKQIVKSALESALPESIRHRKKMGFPIPYDEWLLSDFAPGIRTLLLSDRTHDRGWFQPAAIERILLDHFEGRANHGRQIWSLWNLELWARACLDGERPQLPTMEELGLAAMEPVAAG